MAHGLARVVTHFADGRFGLGIGEAGNFPAGIKAVTEWFPQQERALPSACSTPAPMSARSLRRCSCPLIVLMFDWRMAFYLTGIFGLSGWLPGGWSIASPRASPRVSAAELACIQQDPADPVEPIGWSQAARYKRNLGLCAGQILHRPDLVVLPVLAAGLFVRALRYGPQDLRPAAGRDLPDFGRWQHRRRLDVIAADQGGQTRELCAQDHDAALCAVHRADLFCAGHLQRLGRRCCSSASPPPAIRHFRPISTPCRPTCFRAAPWVRSSASAARSARIGGMGMALFTGYILDATNSYSLLFAICASAYSLRSLLCICCRQSWSV